jgi:aminoglycoside phosphotransferase (APT) family kinase protein
MKTDATDPMTAMRPAVEAYLEAVDWSGVPVMAGRRFRVEPLARGEYNLNYRLVAPDIELVLRVNIGTQIGREDQIVYEYKALKLLEESGYTPRPYAVDDSRRHISRGISIMAFLPGRPLDYRTDLAAAARLLAAIHQVAVPETQNHLIREQEPLSLIFSECASLLARYFESDLADPDIRRFLKEVLAWADAARHRERYFQADPWQAIVNTEVNSGNFIVNPERGTIHLVDWEMPRWGDPSTDLCHFCSPLTTLWKTNYRMSASDQQDFLAAYRAAVGDRHLRAPLAERVRLKDPFVYLRGISWSAMGWVAYQTDYAGIRNPDTWATLRRYMNLKFIRSLFEPFMVE